VGVTPQELDFACKTGMLGRLCKAAAVQSGGCAKAAVQSGCDNCDPGD